MLPIRLAVLSGNTGTRSSMFSGNTKNIFGLSGGSLGARSPEGYYEYAKREIGQYDAYLVRTQKIANKNARESIIQKYYGDPGEADSGSYRRNSVETNIRQAESYTPINYMVFAQDRVQNRVDKLNDVNKGFGDAVKAAENTYGILPAPQIIESMRMVEVSSVPKWVAPVVIGAVGVAALSALGVIKL